jgi:hypothetical protein
MRKTRISKERLKRALTQASAALVYIGDLDDVLTGLELDTLLYELTKVRDEIRGRLA